MLGDCFETQFLAMTGELDCRGTQFLAMMWNRLPRRFTPRNDGERIAAEHSFLAKTEKKQQSPQKPFTSLDKNS
jgi:hypothetical protein